LGELQKINQILVRELNPGAKVIFGLGKDPKLKTGEIQLTLFLSGF
jgi:cell division GTPase FtsZ